MKVRLYTIPGSHPGIAARLMLEQKAIPYKRTDLLPVISKVALKALRFERVTVPALKIDGRRIQGSRQIARELDLVKPEPPLLPVRPGEAGRGRRGGEVRRRGAPAPGPPDPLVVPPQGLRSAAQLLGGGEDRGPDRSRGARRRRRSSPSRPASTRPATTTSAAISRRCRACSSGSTSWIAAGVLDGPELYAADFQIAPSVRLAMTLDDLRPADRGAPRRQAGDAGGPRLSGRGAAYAARGLARAASKRRPVGTEQLERRNPLDPLARRQLLPGVGETGAIGESELGVQLEQRREDEAAARHLAVRQAQPLVIELEVAEQQQVDVERPRSRGGGRRSPAPARPRSACRGRAAPEAPAPCGSSPRR